MTKCDASFMTALEHRSSDPDSSGVPLIIEEDWEPSLDAPLPLMRCVAVIDPDTLERCGRWSIRGLSTCVSHSGYEQFPTVRVYADAVIESARLRLMGMADMAVDALADLLGPDTRQNVRMRAVEVTLDRAGVLTPAQEQKVEVTVNQGDPSRVIAERLERLSASSMVPLASIGTIEVPEDDEDEESTSE